MLTCALSLSVQIILTLKKRIFRIKKIYMSKEQTIFYLKLLLCTSLIGVWIMCLTSLPEPKKEKAETPQKVIPKEKQEVSKISPVKNPIKEKQEVPTTSIVKSVSKEKEIISKVASVKSPIKEKQKTAKTTVVKNISKEKEVISKASPVKEKQEVAKTLVENKSKEKQEISKTNVAKPSTKEKTAKITKNLPIEKTGISGQIHLANKIEVKKMLNDVKSLTNIIAPNKDTVKVEPSPLPEKQEPKPVVEIKPTASPNINLALLNLPNIAGATRKVLDMVQEPEIKISPPDPEDKSENESLRKEVQLEKGTLRPVSDQINAAKNKNKEWVPRYLQEEKKVLEKKVENLSNNLDQLANQIEVRGFVNGHEGQKSVIIRNTLSDRVEILNKGDSYHGVLKLKEINDRGIVLENESLNKTFVKNLSK